MTYWERNSRTTCCIACGVCNLDIRHCEESLYKLFLEQYPFIFIRACLSVHLATISKSGIKHHLKLEVVLSSKKQFNVTGVDHNVGKVIF